MRITLLLVTDDVEVSDCARRGLPVERFKVNHVAKVSDALEDFELIRPGAAVIDLELSNAGGWAIAERLLGLHPLVPLVLLTGCARDYEMAVTIHGATALAKPLTPKRLLQTLNSVLGESKESRVQNDASLRLTLRYNHPYRWSLPCRATCPPLLGR